VQLVTRYQQQRWADLPRTESEHHALPERECVRTAGRFVAGSLSWAALIGHGQALK
jgi:hypothetical protein